MGDANAENFRYLNHFFETNQAQSVAQLDALERATRASRGSTRSPPTQRRGLLRRHRRGPERDQREGASCNATRSAPATFRLLGLPVLDGSRSACDWGTDPDALAPGIFGPSKMPSLIRADYVTNSNDSYWLSNPKQPLEGFARIIGDERTERSLRTRIGLLIWPRRRATTAHGHRCTRPAGHGLHQPPVAGELIARRRSLRCATRRRTLGATAGRVSALRAALGPARRTWTSRRGAVPPLRSGRSPRLPAAQPAAVGARRSTPAIRSTRRAA